MQTAVRRPRRASSAATEALLRHLERVGFDGAPRYLGIDDRGRQVLSYIPGEAAILPYQSWALSDEALVSVAELLRDYHRAVSSFDPAGYDWPDPVPGAFRRVYPGFLQLSAFLSMNLDRHISAHFGQFRSLVGGDHISAEAHRKFYDEYGAVMDLPAEFYLETVQRVFQEHDLPRGVLSRPSRPQAPRGGTRLS